MGTRPYRESKATLLPNMSDIVSTHSSASWTRSMAANAYLEHYADKLPLALERNLDTILPITLGRRDYLARISEDLSKWAPDGWMEEQGDWSHRMGTVEVKLNLSEARVNPKSGNRLKTQGEAGVPAQCTNKSDMEECDVLVAAQGDEGLVEEYREVLGIPVFVLENVEGVMSFNQFERLL